jgi:hypothetical protein
MLWEGGGRDDEAERQQPQPLRLPGPRCLLLVLSYEQRANRRFEHPDTERGEAAEEEDRPDIVDGSEHGKHDEDVKEAEKNQRTRSKTDQLASCRSLAQPCPGQHRRTPAPEGRK